jgi:hypothetical protein
MYFGAGLSATFTLDCIMAYRAMPDHRGTSVPGPYPDPVELRQFMSRYLARRSNRTGTGPTGHRSTCSRQPASLRVAPTGRIRTYDHWSRVHQDWNRKPFPEP